jgi:hypothetical protein
VHTTLASYTLGNHVENGRILATGAANLTGNALNNLLYAGTGNNVLDGGAGSDTVTWAYGVIGAVGVTASLASGTASGSGNDTLIGIEHLIGSPNADRLTGDGNANSLSGGLGNDTLDGGGGADTLTGGDGSDHYYIDHLGDQVIETNATAAGGTDLVHTTLASYTLGNHVENGRILASRRRQPHRQRPQQPPLRRHRQQRPRRRRRQRHRHLGLRRQRRRRRHRQPRQRQRQRLRQRHPDRHRAPHRLGRTPTASPATATPTTSAAARQRHPRRRQPAPTPSTGGDGNDATTSLQVMPAATPFPGSMA